MGENRVGDRGRRRVAAFRVAHDVDPVGREHLQGAYEGRLGEGMGVDAQEERSVDALLLPVKADGLSDRMDMGLVEGTVERRATVTGGPEGDALLRHGGVGTVDVIGRDETGDIGQHPLLGRLPGVGGNIHRLPPVSKL
jgi:hypothetical protein